MKRTALFCRPMTAAAVLMLAAAGMIPLSLVSPSAHGAEPVPGGGTEAASMAVTAPTSFGRSAEPIPDELPAAMSVWLPPSPWILLRLTTRLKNGRWPMATTVTAPAPLIQPE